MAGDWRPFLPGRQAGAAKAVLESILESVPAPDQMEWGPSLANGHAGFALFFGYVALGETGGLRDAHAERALAHLESAAALLPYNPELGFYGGCAGVAWTVDHLQKQGILSGHGDLNEEIDEALLARLEQKPWKGLPELVDGLSGFGLYALDRPPGRWARVMVDRVLDQLAATAEVLPRGTAWFEHPEQLAPVLLPLHPDGAFNLGVAHGNPGVIGFLAEACAKGFRKARPLLDSAMEWLLSCKYPHPDGSIFGRTFGRDQCPNPAGCRLSWCYGDLGIAAVMMMAAINLGQESWREEAVQLALACTRRPDPEYGVKDAGLCHGAAGNAHLFLRLYQATGLAPFRLSASRFYAMALGMRDDSFEAGGYKAFLPSMEGDVEAAGSWLALPGLLMGSTGIGLSLLSATTAVEPCWDRQLLVHIPPAADMGPGVQA